MDPSGMTEAASGEPMDHGSERVLTLPEVASGAVTSLDDGAGSESDAPRSIRDVAGACPYLVDAAGAWRRGHPTRSHRCAARVPPAAIPALMQKRICLTDQHRACEFYVAAAHARESALVAEHIKPEQLLASKFHVLTRSLPLALDRPTDTPVTRHRTPAFLAGAALVGVVALFGALVLGNALLPRATPTLIAGGATGTPSVAPSSLPSTAAGPTPTISVPPSGSTPSPSVELSPSPPPPSPTPTIEPTATPEPTARLHRYRVRRGDTLQKIANQFGTTVRALVDANHLKNAADIKVGQNLIIP